MSKIYRTVDYFKKFNRKFAFSWVDRSNKKNNTDLFGTLLTYNPHGHSFQAVHHFIQIHKQQIPGKKYFKKFDYGTEMNMQR